MNFKKAQHIITIVEEGSITAAARKLFMSQPALSQAIKSIEAEIGAVIFVRGTNPIQLTHAGEKVVEAMQQYRVLENKLQNELSDINSERSGALRLGIPKGIWHPKDINCTLLPSVLSSFNNEFPNVNLNIIQTGSHDIEKGLLEGSLDIGFIRIPPNNPALEYILVNEDILIMIAGKDSAFARNHANIDDIDFSEVSNEAFIAKYQGNHSRFVLDKLFESYMIKPNIMFEFEEPAIAVRMAINLNCMMLFSRKAFYEDNELSSCAKAYQISNYDMSLNSYICYNKNIYLTDYMRKWIEMIVNAR